MSPIGPGHNGQHLVPTSKSTGKKDSETYLSQRKLLTPTIEGTLAICRSEEGLNLLHNCGDHLFSRGVALGFRGSTQTGKEVGDNLAEESVDEERHPRAVERTLCGVRRRKEVRGVGISDELRDDAGLGDDVAIIGKAGYETTLNRRIMGQYVLFVCGLVSLRCHILG